MSLLLARLNHFAWLFLPPLFIFIGISIFHSFNQPTVEQWLSNLWWLSYVGLAVSAAIALQFGRSRLVYGCLLLALYAVTGWQTFMPELLEIRYEFVVCGFVFLLFAKDKGFSSINLFFTLGTLILIALAAWLVFPQIHILSQPLVAKLDVTLYQLSPEIRQMVAPFEFFVFSIAFILGLIRLCWKRDNTHNALFFALILSAAIHIYDEGSFPLITLLFLASLFCYSVIRDSFTMAFKDELTGIPSRRALMQYVQTLGRKYTVVMSDIDHFKKFNDTYGHDVGDEVLKLVASKLDKVSGGGKTFRFGGEEFVMVFPRKNANEVKPFVEVTRQIIADYDIALRAKPRPPKPKNAPKKKPAKDKIVKVTTSFGIAQRTSEQTDFTAVMKQADVALYAAKKAGRNCVQVAKQ